MVNGVSVVICAHNSSSRISPTIRHLAAQVVPADMRWEVLLIDNASTDDTINVAQKAWNEIVPLRIIQEPKLGLVHARWRGASEAQYEIVSFVDDDNWVDENWVATVADIMTQHPEVGVCGGRIEGVFENEPPAWFNEFSGYYAINQGVGSVGDIPLTQSDLFGAGMSIRRDALLSLREQGFRSLLTGRLGKSLASGVDVELFLALSLAGWLVWLDSRLHLRHYMPARRLRWNYLRRVVRAASASNLTTDAYRLALRNELNSRRRKIEATWQGQLAIHLKRFLCHPRRIISFCFNRKEGNRDVIWMEQQIGLFTAILQQRQRLNEVFAQILDANWSQ